MNQIILDLVREGLLEEVPKDAAMARKWLEDGRRHIEAARRIVDIDPVGSYVLSYDGARKAVAAVLLGEGYRAMAVPGSHTAIAKAAVSLASNIDERTRLRRLNDMRRNRNSAEYGQRVFSRQESEGLIELVAWIVEFASKRVAGGP